MTQSSEQVECLPRVPTVPSSHPADYKPGHLSFSHSNWLGTTQNPSFHHAHPVADFAHAAFPVTDLGSYGQATGAANDMQRQSGVMTNHDLAEIELDAQARELFRAFMSCPKFLKYRSGYHSKHQTGKKKSEKDIWPDHIEWAFFRALIRIPPCGRLQATNPDVRGGKKLGRNERISFFIEKTTGALRGRKQVSSHLQVMRPYVAEEPRLLGYLIQPKDLKRWHKKLQAKGLPMYKVSWEGIDWSGNVANSSLLDLEAGRRGYGRKRLSHQPWLLQEFEMSLCTRNDKTGELESPLHTYCSSTAASQLEDVIIDKGLNCFEVLPELFLNNHSRPIGEQVLALEASIQLPNSTKTSGKSELAIYLSLKGPRVSGEPVVDTITTFYQACNQIERQERLGSSAEEVETGDESETCYQIPFCSSFWASILSRLGGSQQRAAEMTTSNFYESATEDVRSRLKIEAASIIQRTGEEIRALTAVQQVSIYSPTEPEIKHHFTLRWQFKAAPAATRGHVSWRLVELPDYDATPLPSPTDSIGTDPMSQCNDGGQLEPRTPDVEVFDKHLASPILLKGDPNAQHGWVEKYDESQTYGYEEALYHEQQQAYRDEATTTYGAGHAGLVYDMQYGQVLGHNGQQVFIVEAVPMNAQLFPAGQIWHNQTGEAQIDPWLISGEGHVDYRSAEYYGGHEVV